MTQAMIVMGVLVICAVSGVLLARRPGRTPGPEEPTGSYTAPTRPVPGAPPATVAAPAEPAHPLPLGRPTGRLAPRSAAPPAPAPRSVAAPGSAPAVRRGRNSGFARFAPAAGPTISGRCRGSHP